VNGSARVMRGGSWNTGSSFVRASHQCKFNPDERFAAAGFRCVQNRKRRL
jgi:formylglycine-generating enzyme required for sulfatase activity